MRQAGRSLPEYRQARQGVGMLEACLTPDLAAEITVQPVHRHKVDAAVFFSDIMVPLKLVGIPVEIRSNVGPVFPQPYRDSASVRRLVQHRIEDFSAIAEAVRLSVAELGETPLLGFAGAPFTLAAYLVEGGPSRDHLAARALMHTDPGTWDTLLRWCAELSAEFLRAQVSAGASAVQLFDSWAGSLRKTDYTAYVQPYSRLALDGLEVPSIHFGTNTTHLLPEFSSVGDALGLCYRTPIQDVIKLFDGDVIIQGNIDPALLSAPWCVLESHIRHTVAAGRLARGHIVNLGHGVPPATDPDVLTQIVELVHSL